MARENVYENTKYRVEIERDCEDNLNYEVVNIEFSTTEEVCGSLPQAMILAKQFEMLLIDNRWEREVIGMYSNGLESVGGTAH